MDVNFKHFIFTRFNIQLRRSGNLQKKYPRKKWVHFSRKNKLDPEWIEQRIRYIKKITARSIKSQTNKNFEWWILVHEDTPEEYLVRLRKTANVFLTKQGQHEYKAAQEVIKKRSKKASWVISSNCDSDDALHVSYADEVQKAFLSSDVHTEEYIDFPFGAKVDKRKSSSTFNKYISCRTKTCNAFRSFVELNTKSIRSVYYVTHGRSWKVAPIRTVEIKKSMWLQLIHEGNLSNRPRPVSEDKFVDFNLICHDYGLPKV